MYSKLIYSISDFCRREVENTGKTILYILQVYSYCTSLWGQNAICSVKEEGFRTDISDILNLI